LSQAELNYYQVVATTETKPIREPLVEADGIIDLPENFDDEDEERLNESRSKVFRQHIYLLYPV